jgi:hypothetical protein
MHHFSVTVSNGFRHRKPLKRLGSRLALSATSLKRGVNERCSSTRAVDNTAFRQHPLRHDSHI